MQKKRFKLLCKIYLAILINSFIKGYLKKKRIILIIFNTINHGVLLGLIYEYSKGFQYKGGSPRESVLNACKH